MCCYISYINTHRHDHDIPSRTFIECIDLRDRVSLQFRFTGDKFMALPRCLIKTSVLTCGVNYDLYQLIKPVFFKCNVYGRILWNSVLLGTLAFTQYSQRYTGVPMFSILVKERYQWAWVIIVNVLHECASYWDARFTIWGCCIHLQMISSSGNYWTHYPGTQSFSRITATELNNFHSSTQSTGSRSPYDL